VARYLQHVHCPRRDLLRGLSAGAGPIVLAYEWDEDPGVEGFDSTMTRALLEMDALRQKVGADKLEAMVKESLELNRKVSGANIVVGFDQGLLYAGLYLTQQGEAVRQNVKRICEATPDVLSGAWGALPGAMQPATAEQIGGVTVDVYHMNLELENTRYEPMVAALYGKEPTLFLAPHTQGVAYAFGPCADARKKLERLLQPDATPLSQDARVVELFRTLTPNPQLCLLFDIPKVIAFVLRMADQFGMPVPSLELEDTAAAWAGLTFYLDERVPRVEVFVPASPIRALIRAARQFDEHADHEY
jgi:hypothetical protein